MITRIIALTLLICARAGYAQTTYIIIHGTWAKNSTWHQPDGDFYRALKKSAAEYDANVVRFVWDGGTTHTARLRAAERLAERIKNYKRHGDVNLVAHSHGTNVAILAVDVLAAEKKNNISQDSDTEEDAYIVCNIYGLATPICPRLYMPNMNTIGVFYNFFSAGDMYQQGPTRYYRRTYPAHERILNLRITVDGQHLGHYGMHSPVVATWLPQPHDLEELKKCERGNFQSLDTKSQGVIHFTTDGDPVYEIDDTSKKNPSRKPSWRVAQRSEKTSAQVPPRPMPLDTLSARTPSMPICAAA